MANLNELQIEKIRSHMLHEEDVLKIKFKAKNTDFETIRIPHNEVEAYEKKGYSVQKKSARRTTMVRPKDHATQF